MMMIGAEIIGYFGGMLWLGGIMLWLATLK